MIVQQLIRCWSIPRSNPSDPIHRWFVLRLTSTDKRLAIMHPKISMPIRYIHWKIECSKLNPWECLHRLFLFEFDNYCPLVLPVHT